MYLVRIGTYKKLNETKNIYFSIFIFQPLDLIYSDSVFFVILNI